MWLLTLSTGTCWRHADGRGAARQLCPAVRVCTHPPLHSMTVTPLTQRTLAVLCRCAATRILEHQESQRQKREDEEQRTAKQRERDAFQPQRTALHEDFPPLQVSQTAILLRLCHCQLGCRQSSVRRHTAMKLALPLMLF